MSDTRYSFSPRANAYFGGQDIRVEENATRLVILVNRKENCWAINVKDDETYHTMPWNVREAADKLGEDRTQAIYDTVREDFWHWAGEMADECGFTAAYQAGHSGGWLAVGGTENWPGEMLTDPGVEEVEDRERFLRFAFAVDPMIADHRERFHAELISTAAERVEHCPNCGHALTSYRVGVSESHNPGCVIGGLLATMEDRGAFNFDPTIGDNLHSIDADALWDEFLGPAVDKIEERLREARA